MTIEINKPELEALIQQRLQAGGFHSVEDLLFSALHQSPEKSAKTAQPGRKSLARLFAESPMKGLSLKFERDADTGRSVEL